MAVGALLLLPPTASRAAEPDLAPGLIALGIGAESTVALCGIAVAIGSGVTMRSERPVRAWYNTAFTFGALNLIAGGLWLGLTAEQKSPLGIGLGVSHIGLGVIDIAIGSAGTVRYPAQRSGSWRVY